MNKQEFLTALWKQLSEVPSEDVEESLDYYSEMIEDRMESGMTEEEAVAAVGSVEDAAKQIIAEIPERRTNRGKKESPKPAADTAAETKAEAPGYKAETPNYKAEAPKQTSRSTSGTGYYKSPYEKNESYKSDAYNEEYMKTIDSYLNPEPEPKKKASGGTSGWKIAFFILGFPIWFPLLVTAGSLIFAGFVTVWALMIAFFAVAGSFVVSGIAGALSLIFFAIQGEVAIGLMHAGFGFILAGIGIFLFMLAGAVVRGTFAVTRAMGRGIGNIFRRKEA
jgi:uncharacterized membrane protein